VRAYANLLPLVEAATANHAIAVVRHDTRPGAGIVHSEPLSALLPKSVNETLIPAVDIPPESEELIERLLRAGTAVTMRLSITNRFSSHSLACNNIVGQIQGAAHPEQVVLVSAHLDSWDLGTGATDDAFGAAAVLGAARALLRSGLRPSRTRFVLFTGEEQGLLGSRAYVLAHAAELDKMVAAFALDWGAGPIIKIPVAGHTELIPLFEQLNGMAPSLGLQAPSDGWMFMTDAYAFTLAGVPGIAPLVRSPAYGEQAHSSEDTLDKVDQRDLRQATTALALASFVLADSPDVSHTRFSLEETRASLIRGNQAEILKLFGLWPVKEW
jgi:carboxypeptidase Q